MNQGSNNPIDVRRCAIYAWSATLDTYQLKMQVASCRSFITNSGWVVVEDAAVTDGGTKSHSASHRLGLKKLTAAAKEAPRPFDCIVIADLARLGRNGKDMVATVQALASHGVSVYAVAERIDTAEPNSGILLKLYSFMFGPPPSSRRK